MRRLNELRLAVLLLTRLPVGQLKEPVPGLAAARWAFPIVGLPLGLLGWAVLAGAGGLGLPPLLAATLALGAFALATGGMHHDGLADFADSHGGITREKRLEIMRDSRVGSYGVLALIFTCLAAASALAGLGHLPFATLLPAVLLIAVGSRFAVLLVLDLMPPARTDGLGQSAAPGHFRRFRSGWLPGLVLVLGLGVLVGPAAAAAIGAMALAGGLVAWRAWRRLGGQTGDVLGAVQLLSETAGWIALAASV